MSLPSQRLPNLLHTALLLALTFFSFVACEAIALVIAHPRHLLQGATDPRLQLIANTFAYLLTLLVSFFTFPALWKRPFLNGLSWNSAAVRPILLFLGLGFLLGVAAQATQTLLPIPKDLPIELTFRDARVIWFLVLFGTLIAPLFEEILFRGFLLPAVAIAIDWLRLPRHLPADQAVETLDAWRASDAFSPFALVLASVVTSLLFALIHAPQLGYTWSAVALLAAVSLVLCLVRIRTHSVAASTCVHACYNLSVFVTLFIATSGFRHLEHIR